MSGITNPAEVYFKDGLWAWAATVWEKLVSSGGRLFTALHGWDGDSWQKLPMLWGYSERYIGQDSLLTHAAGAVTLGFGSPEAGEVWVIENICGTDVDNDPSRIQIRLFAGGIYTRMVDDTAPVKDIYTIWNGRITLMQGDTVTVEIYDTLEDDDCWGQAAGYKMKIAE